MLIFSFSMGRYPIALASEESLGFFEELSKDFAFGGPRAELGGFGVDLLYCYGWWISGQLVTYHDE